MDKKAQRITHAKIAHRVPKTDTCIYGIEPVSDIPVDKPSVVAFGGENTHTLRFANYYASLLKRLIDFYGISGIEIYSAYYYEEEMSHNINALTKNPEKPVNVQDIKYAKEIFNCTNRPLERANIFTRARSKLLAKNATLYDVDTNYIRELYDIIIRPRIADKNGEKLPDAIALRNIRNVIFFTHSHGSAPAYTFQNIMQQDMKSLGYDAPTIRHIMKNILVIQHAPMVPLEKSKFNTISFMSANDTDLDFRNKFSEYVTEHNADLAPSYFPIGNFFVSHGFTYNYLAEHQIVGLVPSVDQDMLTPDGAIIMAAERNTIVNAINAMKNDKPIPSVSKLIAPINTEDSVKPNFNTLAKNGEFFMRVMTNDLRKKKSPER